MTIELLNEERYHEAFSLMYRRYLAEMVHHPALPQKTEEEFFAELRTKKAYALLGLEQDGELKAALLYESGDGLLEVPVFGYGFREVKYLSMLFQKLLEREVRQSTTVDFSCYCHDEQTVRYLSMTRFGICMESCVREIRPVQGAAKSAAIRKLSKEELNARWEEVWPLVRLILEHLQASPVFWFGDEYTEEGYKEFFQEENTSVFAAEQNGRLIGLIESNSEEEGFLLSDNAYNIGEAVLLPEYRRQGLAEALLQAAEEDLLAQGINYSWVTHGTCNPNACAFWDRHFEPYTYCMERSIEL